MAEFSYWEQRAFLSSWDVIVIGSGITGLATAIHLKEKQPDLKVLILEKFLIPHGASTRNAGFACFGSLSELIDDLESHDTEEVLNLVEKRYRGIQYLKQKFGAQSLSLEEIGSHEIFRFNETERFDQCLERILEINRMLRPISGPNTFTVADEDIETFGFNKVQHLIKNQYEGQLDTGYLMMAMITLAQHLGVHIYAGLSVQSWSSDLNGVEVMCEQGYNFKSERIVFATNGFSSDLIDEQVSPARAQVLLTKPIEGLRVKGSFHYDRGYYYFRNIDDRILLGGGRNLDFEGETTTQMKTTESIINELNKLLKEVILPDTTFELDQKWSGIMGVGANKKPIVKQISQRVFCAVKMGGMGVAIGNLIGQEVAEMLLSSID